MFLLPLPKINVNRSDPVMPHVSYANPACPWPNCSFKYYQIDFQLELGDPVVYKQGLLAWEKGKSLTGRCPGCGQSISFSAHALARATPAGGDSISLPDNWYLSAAFLDEAGDVIDSV